MKEFLSNSWVVSIISGIIVFFLTNAFIMFQNKRKYKKQIKDANIMILNDIREYVVDNDLPEKEVINAIKASISRKYNIKFEELLSIKELCEELITDIISNIYISNENKVKYINMLQNYLKDNNNIHNIKPSDNDGQDEHFSDMQLEIKNMKKEIVRRTSISLGMLFSLSLSILSAISVFISSIDLTNLTINAYDIYSGFIGLFTISVLIIIIFRILRIIIEKLINRK